MSSEPLALDASNFAAAFPFHLVVDRQMRVVQMGASIARLLPQLQHGVALERHLCLLSHFGHCNFERLEQDSQQLVVLYHEARQIKLRGQFCSQGPVGFLLLSLWLDTPAEMTRLDLSINDFALHDPVVDMLSLVQAHRTALEDSKALSRSLEHKRRVLAEANAALQVREAELQRLSGELNAIFELSPDGLLAVDARGQFAYVNSAFFQLTGLASLPAAERPGSWQALDDWLRQQTPVPDDYVSLEQLHDCSSDTVELVQERPRTLRRSVRHLASEADGQHGSILYVRDMTRERELDAIKTQFLTTAAHELRTPLTSIYGYVELLRTRDFTPERQRSMLDTIWRQSRQLMSLLNELLDLVHIESRAAQAFHWGDHALAPLVSEVVNEFLPPELGRRWTLAPGPDVTVTVDSAKFRAAVCNLLSNAIKYSPPESLIELTWHSRLHQGQLQVGLAVTDHGCGMTADQLMRAGERFYRADPNGTIPGTGLGLALVGEIMQVLRGELSLHSVWQQGTTATLWLPVTSPASI